MRTGVVSNSHVANTLPQFCSKNTQQPSVPSYQTAPRANRRLPTLGIPRSQRVRSSPRVQHPEDFISIAKFDQ
jgi:hypothetical protein